MSYKPIRKDLTESTEKCEFCPNRLTSLKAYVLKHITTGKLVYAGKTCAEKKLADNETLIGIPDFTKFTLASNEGASSSGGGSGGGGQSAGNGRRRALEYLELREDKLAQDCGTSYKVLNDYYRKSLTEELHENEISHINNIEAKAQVDLKLATLQQCYNYLFWIDVAIAKLDTSKTEFLKEIRKVLVKKRVITLCQKEGVNNWIKFIDGVPKLK